MPEGGFWNEDTLWAKAQSLVQQGADADPAGWLYPFWNVLALEALARCALSRISPTLLADTSNRGNAFDNLLYALGRTVKGKASSLSSFEVFSRCQILFPEFTEELRLSCLGLLALRNAELHSGERPFEALNNWLPQYYESCRVLLDSIHRQLRDLFGEEAEVIAKQMIAGLQDKAAQQVQQAIVKSKAAWQARPEDEKAEARVLGESIARRSEGHVAPCPACETSGLLIGEEMSISSPTLENEEIVVRSTMLPSTFECRACGLRIEGYSKLLAAGLGDTFTATLRSDPLEFYGSEAEDEPYDWDDFND